MKTGLILMGFRYLVCAAVSVLATLLTWVLSPVLAALSFTTRDGNLPRWCYWLQTHDNPLDSLWIGEEGATHRLIDAKDYAWLYKYTNEQIAASWWLKYRARMMWLIRNPAYGVANQLGMDKEGLIELQHVEREGFEWQLWQALSGRYVFRLRCGVDLKIGRMLVFDLGYKPIGHEPRMVVTTFMPKLRKTKK